MLRLTLYKNCRLNNTYQNVMSVDNITINNVTKSVLEFYLDSLDKITIDVEGVYQEFNGQLIFDYDLLASGFQALIYEFNYMKVQQIGIGVVGITRYCFIDELKLVNDLVYLSYSEDFWSSYFGESAGLNKSFLSRIRIEKYKNQNNSYSYVKPRVLPVNFDGNNNLDYNSLTFVNPNKTRKAKILVEVQMYDAATYGSSTSRIVEYFLLSNNLAEDGIDIPFSGTTNYLMSIEGTILRILSFIQNSEIHFKIDGTVNDLHYEVGDVYVIPSEFDINYDSERTVIGPSGVALLGLYKVENTFNETIYGYIINNNFKRLAIGTFNSQIQTINNGTNIEFTVGFTKDKSNISFKLNCMNQIVDITKDFSYSVPIASITSEQLSQYEIARELKNTEINNQYKLEGGKIGTATGNVVGSLTDTVIKGAKYGALIEMLFPGAGGAFALFHGLTKGFQLGNSQGITNQEVAINRDTLQAQFNSNNAPVYSATKGIFGNNTNMINAYEGICEFIIEADNDIFVEESINNLGYVCYEYTDDINIFNLRNPEYYINENINYNIFKFDSVSIYGGFTNNVAKILNGILQQGVKVWFYPYMVEDNYHSI